jgi:uncharacterized membrane protein
MDPKTLIFLMVIVFAAGAILGYVVSRPGNKSAAFRAVLLCF